MACPNNPLGGKEICSQFYVKVKCVEGCIQSHTLIQGQAKDTFCCFVTNWWGRFYQDIYQSQSQTLTFQHSGGGNIGQVGYRSSRGYRRKIRGSYQGRGQETHYNFRVVRQGCCNPPYWGNYWYDFIHSYVEYGCLNIQNSPSLKISNAPGSGVHIRHYR